MTSLLTNLYTDLQGMSVSYIDISGAAKTPKVYGLDDIPGNISTAQVPCRILMPPRGGNVETQEANGAIIRWTINDLFLLDTMAQGQGLKNHAGNMTRYAAAYSQEIIHLWRYPAYGQNIQAPTFQIIPAGNGNPIEYPALSGVYFYGVLVTLTIDEFLV